MSIQPANLSGGLDPAMDFPLQAPPKDPEVRESASMWIYDDAGRFGIPRIAIEALGSQWDYRGVKANIAFPDGRVFSAVGGFSGGDGGKDLPIAKTIEAGPLVFRMIEPFRHWQMTFDGEAKETSVARQLAGPEGIGAKRIRIDLDAHMTVPQWTPGEQVDHGKDPATALAIGAIGGRRHEQLFLCSGVFHVEGEDPIAFSGRGLRILRSGVRVTADFPGHCWQSAVFPSGKAFGILAFPPRAGQSHGHGEAFVYDGKRKHYPRLVDVPWMGESILDNNKLDVTLETERGIERISGVAHCTTMTAPGVPLFGDWTENGQRPTLGNMLIHQGGALYEWNGERAYGMVERSYPADQIKNYTPPEAIGRFPQSNGAGEGGLPKA